MAEEEPKTADADSNIMALKGIKTLFGDVEGEKIVFCIDTSGSTYDVLPTIKEHLTETLVRMAYQSEKHHFNVIQFNSQVKQWSDNVVPCTPETVYLAVKWIRGFESTSGSNLLDALLCAFENDCDSVYVVTDCCPYEDTDKILDHIAYIGKGRPVNCIYVAKGTPEKSAWEFLDELASETFGSFHVVNISRHGCLERVTPIHKKNVPPRVIRTNEGSVYPNLSNCSVTSCLTGDPLNDPVFVAPNVVLNPATGQPVPYYHPYNHWFWWGAHVPGAYGPYMYNPFYSWSRYKASRAFIHGKEKLKDAKDDPNLCPTAAALLIGRKVLARLETDGHYYEGKVKSETYGRRFLVEFSPFKGKEYDDTTFQDTSLGDIVAFDDAFRHPILPGDRVLYPANVDNPTKYLLGTVMEGSEARGGKEESESSIAVALTDGKMSTIPAGNAVWIPNAMYHRVSLEMKMPTKARKKLRETPGYPLISLPGYPTNEDERTPADYEHAKPVYRRGVDLQVDHMLPPFYMPVNPTFETFGTMDELAYKTAEEYQKRKTVPGTAMTTSELQEKVDSQLRNHQKSVSFNSRFQVRSAGMRPSSHIENVLSSDGSIIEKDLKMLDSNTKEPDKCDDTTCEKDSGCDPDLSWEQLHESKVEEEEEEDFELPKPLYRRRPKSAETKPRPPWRHFGKGGIPEMMDRKEHEPYMVRGHSCMETRPVKHIGGAVEWPGSAFGVGDPRSRTRYDRELLLEELSRKAGSQSRDGAWQGRGPMGDLTGQLGRHEAARQQQELDRDCWKRNRVLNREEARQARLLDQQAMDKKAERYRQDQKSAQLDRLRQRQLQEEEALSRQREHKRAVVANLQSRYSGVDTRDAEKDVKRVELIRQRREERESAVRSLDERVQANRRRLEDLHRQRDAARWENVHSRLQAEERRVSAQDLLAREVERNRRSVHRQQEETNQRQLEMKAYAAKQNAPPIA